MTYLGSRQFVYATVVALLVGVGCFAYVQFVYAPNQVDKENELTREAEAGAVEQITDQVTEVPEVATDIELPAVLTEPLSAAARAACANQAKGAECAFKQNEEQLFGNCHEAPGETTLSCIPLMVN